MKHRVAFITMCVVFASAVSTGAEATTTKLKWLRTSGDADCFYSEPLMCRGTNWSTDMAAGAFDAHAVVNGLKSHRVQDGNPWDEEYGATATTMLGRTYGLQRSAPDVRVTVTVDLSGYERGPEGFPGALGGGMPHYETFWVYATHADAAAAGVTCSTPTGRWSRHRWINPYDERPDPGYQLTTVMTCRDAAGQPADVPPGRVRIFFHTFAGATGSYCVFNALGLLDCQASVPDLDTNEAWLHGTARLAVEHA